MAVISIHITIPDEEWAKMISPQQDNETGEWYLDTAEGILNDAVRYASGFNLSPEWDWAGTVSA